MLKRILEGVRSARRIELYAGIVVAAVLALLLLNASNGRQADNGGTGLEARLERIISRIDGAGPVCAMITQDDHGQIIGVVIVAEQLNSVRSYLNLQNAAATLLDVEVDRIEIIGADGFGGGA